jgi:hypothetical protein
MLAASLPIDRANHHLCPLRVRVRFPVETPPRPLELPCQPWRGCHAPTPRQRECHTYPPVPARCIRSAEFTLSRGQTLERGARPTLSARAARLIAERLPLRASTSRRALRGAPQSPDRATPSGARAPPSPSAPHPVGRCGPRHT